MKKSTVILCVILLSTVLFASSFNGLTADLNDLIKVSNAKSRSISPEHPTGEPGKGGMITLEEGSAAHAARDLGQGWKVNPYYVIPSGETQIMADIKGSGAIQHIWLTPTGDWRFAILRMYWDGEEEPSVEVPLGDFFASAYYFKQVTSIPVCVNPGSAFNCYWIMPFRKSCKITVENIAEKDMRLFYQVDYTLTDIPKDAAYFHAQFRRVNPLPYKEVYTIVDGIKGKGHYVGTYMTWQSNNDGWWGEGEIKVYMDGDTDFPTICGTGTEDYFCGSYSFLTQDHDGERHYTDYSTPYAGFFHYPPHPKSWTKTITRYGMYRWHITDPIRFEKELKITMQALGWRSGGRYLPLKDDISSVAYWYQLEPHNSFPELPEKDDLEIR